MATVFFSYSHKDEQLRDELEVHLALLKRERTIETWHDRKISAGDVLEKAINDKIETAEVVLLLVSPDFLASRYCYEIEFGKALQRHEAGTARVIPVILRPCDWQRSPLGKLLAAPKDGRPITKWPDRDEAFLDVVQQIRAALPKPALPPRVEAIQPQSFYQALPRSSNLRVKKQFTDAAKDRFLDETFDFIALYFENSLKELSVRNPEIETSFKRIDAQSFSAVLYRAGEAVGRCLIRIGRLVGTSNSITFSRDDSGRGNSFNESLSVEAGDQSLHLKAIGFASMLTGQSRERNAHLSSEGAAEYYWEMLIGSLQQ
jgi:hypothetical protein